MRFLSGRLKQEELEKARKIYNYFILNSFSNFEEKKLSMAQFHSLYKKTKLLKLPFILAELDSVIIGLAFVNKFREKSGYRFSYEHSIYVNPNYINNGFGSLILKKLIKDCKKNSNIKNLIAVIGGSDNSSSIKIHKKNGFNYIGTLKKIGYKKNRWIDSVYMQRKI